MAPGKPAAVRKRFGPAVKILDRYVAREFLLSYVVALCVVLGLRLLLDLFVQFDEFVEARGPAGRPDALTVVLHVADFYWPKTFEYFRDFAGTIVVLAALFSLARLTRQNELTAVLASGVSLKRVVAPIVLLAVALNLLMALDQELVLPRLADKLVRGQDEAGRLRTLDVSLLPDRDQALLTGRFEPRTQTLANLWVILRNARGQATAVLTADQSRWDAAQGGWLLTEGRLRTLETGDLSGPRTTSFYPSELSPDYLWLQQNSAYKSLMSSSQLARVIQRQGRSGERDEAIAERLFRFTDPIINMVMLLLSLPLIVSRERRSTKTALALVALGAGGCLVATFTCKLLAGSDLTPFLAAALPIIVFTPLSVLALDMIKT